jgi:hypothetical protein
MKHHNNSPLSPAVRSWLDNCIVPILVKEYLAELSRKKDLAPDNGLMAESRDKKTVAIEVGK